MTIYEQITSLCEYGIQEGLIEASDKLYVRNRLLEEFNLLDYKESEVITTDHFEILQEMVSYAFANEMIESDKPPYSDLFEAKVMDLLVPRPSEVIRKFKEDYAISPEKATENYYELSKKSHYIRLDRTSKNMHWTVDTKYGEIDITVNLSKPEKDPKAIAAARTQVENNYPKCLLCKENEGFSGHINHPGRQNHRIIPFQLQSEDWFFQYSPYAYFNEHSIVLKSEHEPMCINEKTFKRLLDFVDYLPHYFIGSNADLPLVGGSMLTHDHYQSGKYVFAMENATVLESFEKEGVIIEHLNWPLSVLRLKSANREALITFASKVFNAWVRYSDESLNIVSHTDERHNTVTPIARYKNDLYELDLVLRNNRIDEKNPTGIFHPQKDVHPVKKENIGLIEVMGLAVLPSRLKDEMSLIVSVVKNNEEIPEHLEKFKRIIENVKSIEGDTLEITKEIVGKLFVKGLEDAGVFKLDEQGIEGIRRFIDSI